MHSGLTYGVLCSDEDYYFLKVEGDTLLSSKIVKVSAFRQVMPPLSNATWDHLLALSSSHGTGLPACTEQQSWHWPTGSSHGTGLPASHSSLAVHDKLRACRLPSV